MTDQLPGWTMDRRGLRYWIGPPYWTNVVNGTVVEYVADRPVAAYGCISTDGTRVTAVCAPSSEPNEEPQWFLPRSDGSFQSGKLEPSADGLVFVTAPARGLSASMYWQGGEKGRAITGERGGSRWRGPMIDAELHGPAVIEKHNGRMLAIRGCSFSSGSRGSVLPSSPSYEIRGGQAVQREATWRRPLHDGSWHEGILQITTTDIVFIDGPQRGKRKIGVPSPSEAPDLSADLLSSPRIAELVKDVRFATNLYRALCNTEWIRNDRKCSTTWRSAGGIVAQLRDLNEEYIDFYCSGDEGVVAEDVAAELRILGWTEA